MELTPAEGPKLRLTPADATPPPLKLTPVTQDEPFWATGARLYTETTAGEPEAVASAVPKHPVDLMAVGLAKSVNDVEQRWLAQPDNLNDNRQRLQELKGSHQAAGRASAELMAEDNPVGKFVGSALMSAPASLAGAVPMMAGAPLVPAVGAGLLWNYFVEAASDYGHRVHDLGQAPDKAYLDSAKHGLVATTLEAGPMTVLGKMASGAMTARKALPRLVLSEGGQEGATQLYDDLSTNAAGLTRFTPTEIAGNVAEAAGQGALIGPIVGGPIALQQVAKQWGQQTAAKVEIENILAKAQKQRDEALAALAEVGATTQQQANPGVVRPSPVDLTTPPAPEEVAREELAQKRAAQRAATAGIPVVAEASPFYASLNSMTHPEQEASPDEGQVSDIVQANRAYRRAMYEPSDIPTAQKPILYSTDSRVEGLTLEQAGELQPGTITVLREDDQAEVFPGEPYSLLMQDMKSWMKKYAPQARIILNLEQFKADVADRAFGLHMPGEYVDAQGNLQTFHVITPRELPGFKYQGGDSRTATALVTALTHEFGHMLVYEGFAQGLQERLGGNANQAAYLMDSIRTGGLSPAQLQQLAQIAPQEAALLQTWQTERERLLTTMTAEEYMETWAGARKVTSSVDAERNSSRSLYAWMDERIQKANLPREGLLASELLIGKMARDFTPEDKKWLETQASFDEFMAEQYSRHAYTSGAVLKSKFGEYFANTMAKLKALFRDLKTKKGTDGKAMIAPQTTFKEWIDGLTLRAKLQRKGTLGHFKTTAAIRGRKPEEKFGFDARGYPVKTAEGEPVPRAEASAEAPAEKPKRARKGKEETLPPPEKTSWLEQPPSEEPAPFVEETGEETLARVAVEEQIAPAVVETAKEHKAWLIDRLTTIYSEIESPSKWQVEKFAKLHALVTAGQFAEAEQYITKMENDSLNWDEDYTSKVLERLGPVASVKKATFELTMKQKDISAVERAFWSGWVASQPDGRISVEDAVFALQEGIMPLQFQVRREDRVWTTDEVLGGEARDRAAAARGKYYGSMDVTHVWTGEAEVGGSHHYTDLDNYTMHSRVLDSRDGIRYVIELQSDAYQLSKEEREEQTAWGLIDEQTDPRLAKTKREQSYMKRNWWKRLIREEIRLAFENGLKKMRFRTADTAAKLEGWEAQKMYEGLKGAYYVEERGFITPEEAQTVNPLKLLQATGGIVRGKPRDIRIEVAFKTQTGGPTYIEFGPETAGYAEIEALNNEAADGLSYGENQVIYDRYAGPMAVFLSEEYGAKQVSHRNLTWLEIDVTEKGPQNVYWDQENPLSPMIPGTLLTDHVGLTEEEQQQPERVAEAQTLWETRGFDSPYFKRFAEGTKVVGNDNLPVRVWRSRGSPLVEASGVTGFVFFANPANLQQTESKAVREKGPAQPIQQPFFLSLKNPKEVDLQYAPYSPGEAAVLAEAAAQAGHDGLIFRHAQAPLETTLYVAFDKGQIAQESSLPKVDQADAFYWDMESDLQQTSRGLAKVLQFAGRARLHAVNARSKGLDMLMQLQQVAASQPEDEALRGFMAVKWAAERMKNQMQYFANETVKSLVSFYGTARSHVEALSRVLNAEQAGGVMQGELVGLDEAGQVLWRRGEPRNPAVMAQVREWRVQDSLSLRTFLADQGVDVTTNSGAEVLQHYLDVRNVMQAQFTGLANALVSNAMRRFEQSPSLLHREILAIEDLHRDLREAPHVPQGHFGRYVLLIQQDLGPRGRGKSRFVPVFRKHFETQAEFQQAYTKAQKLWGQDPSVKVTSKELKEEEGMPIQLPRELLSTLEESGEYTQEQLQLLRELMVSPRHAKIADRYAKAMQQIAGANKDFTRTFAAYTWHNSNYIWKLQYGPALRSVLGIARATIAEAEASESMSPEEKLTVVTRQRRNLALMEAAVNYMLRPENELQALRYWATMAYLAYSVSTAVSNLSTQINYWAAITAEYGELKGNKYYAQSLTDIASLPWWEDIINSASTSAETKERLQHMRWAYNRAVEDGLLDQSYAYYLAGQANSGGTLSSTATSAVGQVARQALETGMFPFRAIEKLNRISTFFGFYNAELAAGAMPLNAYQKAAERTDLLQNAYDAANRPRLFRGKKAIVFMFASFTQISQWTMWGGYERAVRAQQTSEGKPVRNALVGSTMRMWLIYGLLGGLLGLPGASDMLELVKWAWRKFFGTENVETELRKFLQDMDLNPQTMLHGILHDAGGFDSSGKFGLGRVVPGVDLLNREFLDPMAGVGQGTLATTGPAGGLITDAIRMLGHFGQGQVMEGFKQFPGVIGSVSKATDAYLAQQANPTHGVVLSTGERLTWDAKRQEFRDLTGGELVGMALGLNPSILSQNRDIHFTLKGEEMYWKVRRADLMDQWARARRIHDREMEDVYLEKIRVYNESVPFRGLAITGKDRMTSLKARQGAMRKAEIFGTTSKQARGLARDIRGSFADPSPEGEGE